MYVFSKKVVEILQRVQGVFEGFVVLQKTFIRFLVGFKEVLLVIKEVIGVFKRL